jgi:hypothetical protein
MLTYTFTRADASIAGQATGAMSWAFINALKKNPQQSYVQLLNSIRSELETKYTQKPQLSCSHPLGKSDHILYSRQIISLTDHWLDQTSIFSTSCESRPGG